MTTLKTHTPTPYPDVNTLLLDVLSGAQAVLGENFVGMYLYGSLASGGFDAARSDVDFLVATAEPVTGPAFDALADLHARIAASGAPWADHLEGSYIPLAALRRYDPARSVHPHVGVGERFGLAGHDYDWVLNLCTLREHGVVLAGPPPRTFIDPVTPEQIRAAVAALLRSWWAPIAEDASRLQGEYQPYAVLTMCRALYALSHGEMLSKPDAAAWAQESLDGRWTPLIERALAWRHGDPTRDVEQTQEMIAHTLRQAAAV